MTVEQLIEKLQALNMPNAYVIWNQEFPVETVDIKTMPDGKMQVVVLDGYLKKIVS